MDAGFQTCLSPERDSWVPIALGLVMAVATFLVLWDSGVLSPWCARQTWVMWACGITSCGPEILWHEWDLLQVQLGRCGRFWAYSIKSFSFLTESIWEKDLTQVLQDEDRLCYLPAGTLQDAGRVYPCPRYRQLWCCFLLIVVIPALRNRKGTWSRSHGKSTNYTRGHVWKVVSLYAGHLTFPRCWR